jgi:hypothetical protein
MPCELITPDDTLVDLGSDTALSRTFGKPSEIFMKEIFAESQP